MATTTSSSRSDGQMSDSPPVITKHKSTFSLGLRRTKSSGAPKAAAVKTPIQSDIKEVDGKSSPTLKLCKICTKKPLRHSLPNHLRQGGISPHDNLLGGDNGLIELIHSIRNQKLYDDDTPSVELSQADDIVARSKVKVQELQDQRRHNIQQYAPQDLNLYKENLDAMGKFDWDELRIGALLGIGGFSNVSEICGFRLESPTGMDRAEDGVAYTNKEQVARKFLSKHAKRTTQDNAQASLRSIGSSNRSIHSTHSDGTTTQISHRYALKHLRPKLSEIYNKRTFNCAAVDLITEAHFLMAIQHPNIIKIRGFAASGPEGYKTGNHNGYFLILDQLPETMEQRLLQWRKRVKKYKSFKRSLVTKVLLKKNREMASRKLDELLEERYVVAAEICGAMEYLHDRRCINRDLKIQNIGFDVRGDVKLFDFGLSRWLPTSLLTKPTKKELLQETFHMSSVGTQLYMAPEVKLKQPYSTKADVYSFGIVLWEMLCLSDPQWQKHAEETNDVIPIQAAKAPDLMPICPCWPQPLSNILKRCISATPNERPSFTEIRQLFREELLVILEDDEFPRPRQSLASLKANDFVDDNDHISDDEAAARNQHSRYSVGSEEEDEGRDAVGELGVSDSATNSARRRSTYVLNFTDLSWLSSSNSLRFNLDGSMKDNSSTSTGVRGQTRGSGATTGSSSSSTAH